MQSGILLYYKNPQTSSPSALSLNILVELRIYIIKVPPRYYNNIYTPSPPLHKLSARSFLIDLADSLIGPTQNAN